MKAARIHIPLFVLALVIAAAALYCTLGVLARADDAGELALKRLDAMLLTLLWPTAFAVLGSAVNMTRWLLVVGTTLILALARVVGAGSMQKEYSRDSSNQSVFGF